MPAMTDEQIRRCAEFYGIDMDEAQRRYEIVQAHTDDRRDPICVGCARRPPEIDGYRVCCAETEDEIDLVTDEQVTRYVIRNEGTYNPLNGHFLCDSCYIKNGMPTHPHGWRCP